MFAIGKKQYFVFPWANGGNLLDLWRSRNSHHDRSLIARQHIPDIVNQLVGMTYALATLHAFSHGQAGSYRHGDLKPENVLIFDTNQDDFLGNWKMADLGLARYHIAATGDRIYVTSNSGAGTISYQPPESFKSGASPTSRLYDIWSMGCILLQLMTWLLYGTRKIDELTRNTKSAFAKDESSYWTACWNDKRGYHKVKVHLSVKNHIEEMKRDVQGSQALQDLLSIIEDKLLVVQLPEKANIPKMGCRTSAADLHESLRTIQKECGNPSYWLSNRSIVKQASHPRISREQATLVRKGNKVSSNSLISS